uniref:Reverse transcriptase domain-containing protein n=1 Tax=Tanacetum cinerariifolium TaxID=118510 RepID=A0A6L2K0J7_TANCI|nr:reverse transcriptase domain-containing protein [Tanacetum cinerariifolium]
MYDEPMWVADHVVALTPGSTITILKTANEFAIKDTENEAVRPMMFPLSLTGEAKTWLDELNEGTIKMWDELQTTFISRFFPLALFDRLLREFCAFSQHENESLIDAWLRMKKMLRNCHGYNLSKCNIIKIFYHGLNEITQEVLNAAADGIFLYKTSNQAYHLLEDKVLLKLDWAKNQKTKSSLKKTVASAAEGNCNSDTDKIMARMDVMTINMDAQYKELQSHAKQPTPNLDDDDIPMSQTFMDLKTQLEIVAKNHQASIQNLATKFGRLADKQSGRPSGSLSSNTHPNPRGNNSKAYQPSQSRNEHVNVVFTRSVIRVKHNQLNLGVGTERMIFNIDSAIKHSYANDDTCFSIDVINEILEEDFDALLDEGRKILYSIEGTVLEEEIFSEFDKFIAMAANENYDSESDEEEPKFEKITINTDYKIKTSFEEPLIDLELKPLHDNLEYVFLEEPFFLLVIISSQLSAQNKCKLVYVLKKHKEAFAWKTTNIPDQEKTTFTCPFGTYAYRRMPFGLCNAPTTFQRCMLAIFHDMIEESVEVFMDDFSVFGNSFEKCLNNLEKMLQRWKDAHLVLNWEKCHFMVKEGIVLGHKAPGA